MKNLNIPFVLLLFSIIYISCSNLPATYMSFEDIEYVEDFPQELSLKDAVRQNIDVIGGQDFLISDSVMLISSTNRGSLWKAVSLPEHQVLGGFLKKGQGPYEFVFPPFVNYNTRIIKENDELYAYLYDSGRGKLLKLNISKSLKTGNIDISMIEENLPKSLFNIVALNDSLIFCKEVNQNHTKQNRFIFDANKRLNFDFLEKLNDVAISPKEDINILSTITKYNAKNKLILEVPIGLNYINIYSLEGGFAKTICVGEVMYSIEKVEAAKKRNRPYTFANVYSNEKFWGVLYMNETEKGYLTNSENLPSLLFFDWNGKPIMKINLKEKATSFDLDILNKVLYTYDHRTKEFYSYDIKSFMKYLTIYS